MRYLLLIILITLIITMGCDDINTAENSIDVYFKQILELDREMIIGIAKRDNLSDEMVESQHFKEIINLVLDKVKYETIHTEIKDKKATVFVNITAPNMMIITFRSMVEYIPKALLQAFSANKQTEDLDSLYNLYIVDALNQNYMPMITSCIVFVLEKEGEWWTFNEVDGLFDALTGYYGTALKAFEEEENEGI